MLDHRNVTLTRDWIKIDREPTKRKDKRATLWRRLWLTCLAPRHLHRLQLNKLLQPIERGEGCCLLARLMLQSRQAANGDVWIDVVRRTLAQDVPPLQALPQLRLVEKMQLQVYLHVSEWIKVQQHPICDCSQCSLMFLLPFSYSYSSWKWDGRSNSSKECAEKSRYIYADILSVKIKCVLLNLTLFTFSNCCSSWKWDGRTNSG